MARSAALKYWDFLDDMVETPSLSEIKKKACDGDRIVSQMIRNPKIAFGGFDVDFTEDVWDFRGITTLNISPATLRIRFHETPLKNHVKLYSLCKIVWRNIKVQSISVRMPPLERALLGLNVTPSSLPLLTLDQCLGYFSEREAEVERTTLSKEMQVLADFLSFFDLMFAKLVDERIVDDLRQRSRDLDRKTRDRKYQCVPDDYLDYLVGGCQTIMRDDSRSQIDRITAATTLIYSQTGLRTGELLGTKAGSLAISKGVCGEPDITYMTFPSVKGAQGNDNALQGRTIINDIALEAYLWLERNCEQKRQDLNIDTLVIYPNQSSRYVTLPLFREHYEMMFAQNTELFPCLNTTKKYPELRSVPAKRVLRNYLSRFAKYGFSDSDLIVFPTIHQYRVTVATKLYESGVDMNFIRLHMNHLDEKTTAGYIRSDKEIERAGSERVYRAIVGGGARLTGTYANQFMEKVQGHVNSLGLDEKVAADLDEIIASVSERYPLRRKLGGVCIRCGNVVPCSRNDKSDEILCAFGVCPNQCQIYFMADETLEMVRTQIKIAERNYEKGHTKAARNEIRKAQNVINSCLIPELEGLEEQIRMHGAERVIAENPNLESVVVNFDSVRMEVEEWMSM